MAKAGCVYCDKGDFLNECPADAFKMVVIPNSSILSIYHDKGLKIDELNSTTINYCPMCGRKLNER